MPNEDKESLLRAYKELILRGEVRALSIDSSTFRTYGCRLESGILRQLGQFRGSAIGDAMESPGTGQRTGTLLAVT
jgi:hypothetical protein